ncbi:DUF1553 domain-containing protein [Paludisphaera borealis]|uniref:Cytochrome c domain-containing protein n=1 Tax=Paludisphaera borealis TaxID=1387353 RepID=A0A1U7CNT6_9BACT|nr:DUF1553 domain-containing protein [Paludisphaera borealis]APW60600.1 hypothetical protein BSF38_02075 [Paludisphaera borealis]
MDWSRRASRGGAAPGWRSRSVLGAWCVGLLAAFICTSLARAEQPSIDFSRDVLPILSNNCLLCHGPDANARKADLRLDLKESALRKNEPIIEPGKSAASEFISRLTSDDPDERMPPAKSGKKLTQQQVETLTKWVDQGANWGKHWAFETPKRPEPPTVRRPELVRNTIDRFIVARLEHEGLEPAKEAERATLIRRLALDLTGLPPTPAEVDAFRADRSPDAYEKVVDRLLASPQYGERMAMDWLDGARYADTNGYQNDFARTMWPWRDWAVAAFNSNQPFDAFTIDQIAGDLLPSPTLPQKIATGFNRNNRTVTEAGSIEEEWRIENAIDRVETTATVFLGLTMGCARCHDHKYDPLSQKEFYEFVGFFNNVNEKGVYTETRGNVPPLIAVPSTHDQERVKELEAAIAAAESAHKGAEAKVDANRKAWEEQQHGKPLPGDSVDWSLRSALNGDLAIQGSTGETANATYRGKGAPRWTDGPGSRALALDGQADSYVETKPGVSLDRVDPFTIGVWVRPLGDGACLSKMDDAGGHRGYDLLIQDAKVQVHMVHAWPADALKVTTKETLPRDVWSHVVVSHDGSGKAAGLKIYLDGRPATLEVQADQLKGTLVNQEPLRIGTRATGLALKGELADLRIYRRNLSADDVRVLFDRPILEIAQAAEANRTRAQKDVIARYFRGHVDRELPPLVEKLAQARKAKADYDQQIPTVMIMEDAPTPRPNHLLKRGQYDQPDTTTKLGSGVPECLGPLPSSQPTNRLGLARWMASAENPLTSRVAVNRIWQHHFGNGLVKTAENFGLQSEAPSHPELLDWLATEFVRTGWDVKGMHRLIVTSATYRQVSKTPSELVQRDPENRLLARGPRFRLPAEVVRDNVLAVAGLLSTQFGGPSVKPYQPAGLWEELAGGAGEAPYVQDKGANLYRRSVYIYRKRTVPHPLMATFDAPSREICQVKRARTNTPLQALELLNDVTYVEASRSLAELMITLGGSTPDDRIAFAFRRAVSREPSETEQRVLSRGLEGYLARFRADREAAAKYIQEGDRPAAAAIDPAELAAYTATASVILNLDETITLE